MLFDLRGRGRRRTVQIIYLGLALLIGVGLVGFGVGGGLGGTGILSSLNNNNGSPTASYTQPVKRDRKATARDPSNPAAWAQLARDLYLEAGTGDNYDSTTGAFTAKGQAVLREVASAWQRYLTLNPLHPSADLARLMINVYGTGGLNQPSPDVAALQIVIASDANDAQLYSALAQEAYAAKNIREGDLASAKAVSLAPSADRAELKADLASLRTTATGTTGATSTTASVSTSTAVRSSSTAAKSTHTSASASSATSKTASTTATKSTASTQTTSFAEATSSAK
jgi:hypothetical protein